MVVDHPFVGWATEDERTHTDHSNRDSARFPVGEEPEFAESIALARRRSGNQEQVHDCRIHVGRGNLKACGRTATMTGVCPRVCRPNIPLKIPHHARMRTPLRQRIAAIAQAVAPRTRKSLPGQCHQFAAERSRAASAAFMPSRKAPFCLCFLWDEVAWTRGVGTTRYAATRSYALNGPSVQNCISARTGDSLTTYSVRNCFYPWRFIEVQRTRLAFTPSAVARTCNVLAIRS